MRKGIAVFVIAGTLIVPAAAQADKEIVAAAPDTFTTPNVTMDQGEPLTFRNTDAVKSHDVVAEDIADGKPIFRSALIAQGTSFVEGSQFLKTGTYKFFCSIHSNMQGTLNVTANGTPKPRPGATSGGDTPVGDTTPPAVTLNVGLLRASTLRAARKLTLRVGSDEAGAVRISIRSKGKTIARLTSTIGAGTTKRLTVKLGRSARAALIKGRKLEIAAIVTDASGNAGGSRTTAPLR